VKAKAPGKIVLSGAYAVLEGAPAIVSAVDRYVLCDTELAPERVTPEVRAALPHGPFPGFDASELRDGPHKLGLGSSAAILVAALGAVRAPEFADDEALRAAIEGPALRAHREAQGGGSGIDVAASTRGGTLIVRRTASGALEIEPARLPPALHVEVWASGVSASTPELLRAVADYRRQSPRDYEQLMSALSAAAARAAAALRGATPEALIAQLSQQRELLGRLSEASGVPIITPEVRQLAECAQPRGAAVLPSGAGGGDIVLWVGLDASPHPFRELASSLRHRLVPVKLHARGMFALDRPPADRKTGVQGGS
jgi:phosphomevalonate kinase